MGVLPQLVVVKFRDLERETALERRILARSGKEVALTPEWLIHYR